MKAMKEMDWKYLKDLKYGVNKTGEHTTFRIWAPKAKTMALYIYASSQSIRRKKYKMTRDEHGVWCITIENLKGLFYNYLVDGLYEVIDPYVESCNANSAKGCIIKASEVSPEGFEDHLRPKVISKTQSIIYEVHIKDFSSGDDLPFVNKGKYLSFTEKGLLYNGEKIGIDHLVELGITHVHLLPVYDFITVNDYHEKDYNWGYDPYLFNVPEGGYSTDPDEPSSRIIELKSLIMALHEVNIAVILDVVYNHTYFTKTSNFERLMPDVFYRKIDGEFSNGSGCGNELKTEHPMVGKFIIDSLIMWLTVYKVDGFRFDLMALYDDEFVKSMTLKLQEIYPEILLYGEPWIGGTSILPYEKQFVKGKQNDIGVALFNDDFRNAIKGSNDGEDSGFVGHGKYRVDDVYSGCFGSVSYSNEIVGFASKPSETINYVSSHDNLILMDKIEKAFHHYEFEDKQNLNALALSFVLLSLGIPFLQAGTEFLRSKYGDHNSYKSPYYVNRLHWENKDKHKHVFDYVKTLIKFRKSQKFYTLDNFESLKKMIKIIQCQTGVIAYEIESPFKEDYTKVAYFFNGKEENVVLKVGSKKVLIDGALYFNKESTVKNGNLMLPSFSAVVLIDMD